MATTTDVSAESPLLTGGEPRPKSPSKDRILKGTAPLTGAFLGFLPALLAMPHHKKRVGGPIRIRPNTVAYGLAFILLMLVLYKLNMAIFDSGLSASDLDARPLSLVRRRAQFSQLSPKEPSSRSIQLANRLSSSDLGDDDDPELGLNLADMPPAERRCWVKLHWPELKSLQSDNRSIEFQTRIVSFFNTSHDHCRLRFFKMWIAPVSEFQSRELLCLLSVFKHHPTACVVILSRPLDSQRGREVLRPLVDAGYKVAALSPDLSFLAANTPVDEWLESLRQGRIDPGRVPLPQNLSNILRLLALYRYGGIYLDNDMLVLRSMAGLKNVIGAQSHNKTSGFWHLVNNAMLCFDPYHPVVRSFLNEFVTTFNGNIWGHNGPYLATRVLKRRTLREEEANWTVLPKEAFYPLDWKHIPTLFSAPQDEQLARRQLDWLLANSYALHLWNRESRKLTVQVGSLVDLLFRWVLEGTNFTMDYGGSSTS